jgi:hypothetical protein
LRCRRECKKLEVGRRKTEVRRKFSRKDARTERGKDAKTLGRRMPEEKFGVITASDFGLPTSNQKELSKNFNTIKTICLKI